MTQNHTVQIKASVLAADRASIAAVQEIQDYAPSNKDYETQSLLDAQTDLDHKLALLAQADAAVKTARDEAVLSAHAMHNKVVGMRDSVGVQFGKSSNQFQAVGRKKATEYKKPKRKASKTSTQK